MSWHGRQCCAHLRYGEDAIERLGGPLPDELARIRAGKYDPIVRRLEPAFEVGARFVIVTDHQRAQFVRDNDGGPGEVIPAFDMPVLEIVILPLRRTAKGQWSVPFNVYDRRHRSGGLATSRPLREELHDITTLVPVRSGRNYQPEPPRIPNAIVEKLPATVAKRANYEHEQRQRRAAYDALPLEVRLALVKRDAEAAGVDLTRQFASIEQRIKAAESKVRRLAESTSARAA